MNQMILSNLGTQLQDQINNSVKESLADKYFSWLKSIIKAEAPALSGQDLQSEEEGQEQPAKEEEAPK